MDLRLQYGDQIVPYQPQMMIAQYPQLFGQHQQMQAQNPQVMIQYPQQPAISDKQQLQSQIIASSQFSNDILLKTNAISETLQIFKSKLKGSHSNKDVMESIELRQSSQSNYTNKAYLSSIIEKYEFKEDLTEKILKILGEIDDAQNKYYKICCNQEIITPNSNLDNKKNSNCSNNSNKCNSNNQIKINNQNEPPINLPALDLDPNLSQYCAKFSLLNEGNNENKFTKKGSSMSKQLPVFNDQQQQFLDSKNKQKQSEDQKEEQGGGGGSTSLIPEKKKRQLYPIVQANKQDQMIKEKVKVQNSNGEDKEQEILFLNAIDMVAQDESNIKINKSHVPNFIPNYEGGDSQIMYQSENINQSQLSGIQNISSIQIQKNHLNQSSHIAMAKQNYQSAGSDIQNNNYDNANHQPNIQNNNINKNKNKPCQFKSSRFDEGITQGRADKEEVVPRPVKNLQELEEKLNNLYNISKKEKIPNDAKWKQDFPDVNVKFNGYPKMAAKSNETPQKLSIIQENQKFNIIRSELSEEKLCIICLDKESTFTLVPCGHKKYCEKCAEAIVQKKVCAICMKPVQSCLKVYE